MVSAVSALYGADTLKITLPEVITRARVRSVNAAVALNELRQAYWEYRSYRAELLPSVNFSAKIPGYYRQYSTFMDAEGNYSFVGNDNLNMSGKLSLDQNIWLTGGKISLNTSLDFIRQLSGETYNRYMSTPVALTLEQPLLGVNTVKWDRRIEPVKYREAKAEFLSASEDVAIAAISYYFNLLAARENHSIAIQNYSNAVKLHEVAVAKREMGQISKNDLLQMELNELNALSSLTEARSTFTACMFNLKAFLDFDSDVVLEPEMPSDLPDIEIDYPRALELAMANNKFASSIRRKQLEADYEVARAKADMRQIDLFAQIGYTGTAKNVSDAYNRLRSNQIVEVGISLPLVDWGRRKGKVKAAESNRRTIESRNRLDKINFDQDLFVLVERFGNQRMQLQIARRADEIAAARYHTNVETYLIGRISTLDLNDSQSKKDSSRQDLVDQLYRYWLYYYQLRSITLWDFVKDEPLDADFDEIVRGE